MLILGVLLIVLGAVLGIPVLMTIGTILAVIGLLLVVLGATGVGGVRHGGYW